MEVLQPSLVWVGNRCYRKLCDQRSNKSNCPEDDVSQVCDVYADEICDVGVHIDLTANGFRASLPCPGICFGLIIGRRGETKKKIESETRTQIHIPRQGESGDIEIHGQDRLGIVSAHTRINLLVESVRHRHPFTHFISIPMVGRDIQTKFDEFKESVLQFCKEDKGVDATIFQNRNKLHLTVGTLTLLDDREILNAAKLFEDYRDELISTVLENHPMVIEIQDLEYMNDDPNAVDILYAKVSTKDGCRRLQTLVDAIVDRFVSAGLMERQYERVKMHITVMNTLFRKEAKSPSSQTLMPNKERECFDARQILKLYNSYDFGQLHVDAIHLSERMSTASNGYYSSVSTIMLP